MALVQKVDFSTGPVWKRIISQAIPLTIAQLVQLLEQINSGAQTIAREYPDLKELSEALQESSRLTIDRVSTVQS